MKLLIDTTDGPPIEPLTLDQCQTIRVDAIPPHLVVEVPAIRVKTGESVRVKEPASQAISDLQATIEKYHALLEHVQT